MRIVVVTETPDKKIMLTKDELQKMLDDAYGQGLADAGRNYPPIVTPSWQYTGHTYIDKDKIEVTC